MKTFSKEKRDAILQKVRRKEAVIKTVKKVRKSNAPSLYDLTELRMMLIDDWAFRKRNIINHAKLYEQHKLITYPRTDSRYVTTDIVEYFRRTCKSGTSKTYASIETRIISAVDSNKSIVC